MWGSSEEPPETMEAGPPEPVASLKETCELNKSQLDSLKEIMLRNKQTLKKKEEDVEEYAKKLSKYKSRAKMSRRSADGASSSSDPSSKSKSETSEGSEDVVDDISQARTPKAKSSLLQKKLAEDRKIFERRSKEMIESKKMAEEKVEALLQQLDQTPPVPLNPVLVTSQRAHPVMEVSYVQDKDKEIKELYNKITNLQATIVDLQENLKEKDSVIDSKTKAITLMSADLSMKGKTTLDTLEDTKDEMRSMQENFVLLETSLRNKNDNLLEQLQERNNRISELEQSVQSFEEQIKVQKDAETASANHSRSTMNILADTKDAMQSMQENFILIESSLKDKNENLLKQLEEREIQLSEAAAKILKLESGMGIVREPEIVDFPYRIEKLERANRQLEDEKFELQKSIAEMQERILASESPKGNGLIIEKDNRIAELENLIEALKMSNQKSEDESIAALEKQITEIMSRNEEVSNRVIDLERLVDQLETERNDLASKVPTEGSSMKDDETITKLTKELEDLNKLTIKLKAQHKSKVKNLQQQLENFKKVSDTNAELVKLGNQVTLLEEEKGNLQLSLVDFDELKALAGDWKKNIADLEGKVSSQAKEIQTHIEAIATLENQKLDLMQELHEVKQELSGLEAEIAESENLRVTAEMKIVDLEEQLDSSNKLNVKAVPESEHVDFQKQIDALVQENEKLMQKIAKFEEKGTSDVGSTESFVKAGSNIDSTESFDTLNDTDKTDLLKRIDILSRENSDLLMKLSRIEEKGSSDTGSTESFEKIPEQVESSSKLEMLTRENNELVIKLTKLEERFANLDVNKSEDVASEEEVSGLEGKVQNLIQENSELVIELTKLKEKMLEAAEEKVSLQNQIETLVTSYNQQKEEFARAEERTAQLESENPVKGEANELQRDDDTEQLRVRIQDLTDENIKIVIKAVKLEEKNQELLEKNRELIENTRGLMEKNQELVRNIQEQAENLEKITSEREQLSIKLESTKVESVSQVVSQREDENVTITALETEIEEHKKLIAEQKDLIEDMKNKLSEKEEDLAKQSTQISNYETSDIDLKSLREELQDSASAIEEWKLKCSEMENKTLVLEEGKRSIEVLLSSLQDENKILLEDSRQKNEVINTLKHDLSGAVKKFEEQLKEYANLVSTKDNEIEELKRILVSKDSELHDKYSRIQNDLIAIDQLQDELTEYKEKLHQQEVSLVSLNEEVEIRKVNTTKVTEDLTIARDEITKLKAKLKRTKSREDFDKMAQKLFDKDVFANDLEKKLQKKAAEFDKLEEENIHLTEANRKLQKNFEALEIQLKESKELFDNNTKYMEDLKAELQDSYRMLEQLKIKHTEDVDMQERRLEELLVELNEKNKQIGECVGEDVKGALKCKVSELETKLSEAERKMQSQLEKMKKYIAVIKKKTLHNEELEGKLVKLEEQWTSEKDEKEAKNRKIQELESLMQEKDNQISDLGEKMLQMVEVESLEAKEVMISDLNEKLLQAKAELDEAKENLTYTINQLSDVHEAKNNIISELGEKVSETQMELSKAAETVATLRTELKSSEEIIADLSEQLTQTQSALNEGRISLTALKSELVEMGASKKKEVDDLTEIHNRTYAELVEAGEKLEALEAEINDLREAKENARELGVRMEFMEQKDMEQRALINSLKMENGMLMSKQAQINEKLENVEKESDERRILLEKMQKEKEIEETEMSSDDPEVVCRSGQCRSLVQLLEAKLQEREAEIENLDNEMFNSIGNILRMQDDIQLNQSAVQNRRLQEYNDLVTEYNALSSVNEEHKAKLEESMKENKELNECISSLQELNATLQERISAVEKELAQGREASVIFDNVNTLYAELVEKYETKEQELEAMHKELAEFKETHEMLESNLRSNILQLQSEKEELLGKYNSIEAERKTPADKTVVKEEREQENASRVKREIQEEAPPLFDAFKAFGMPESTSNDSRFEIHRLENVISAKDDLHAELTNEIARLKKQIADDSLSAQEVQARLSDELTEMRRKLHAVNVELNNLGAQLCMQLGGNENQLEATISSKNEEIATMQAELSYARETLAGLKEELGRQNDLLQSKNSTIDALEAEKSRAEAQLNDLVIEKREAERIVNHIIAIAEDRAIESRTFSDAEPFGHSSSIEGLGKVEFKLSEILAELDMVKSERDQLLASHEVYRTKVLELEHEIKFASDVNRVQELEERVSKILSERDILQLQVTELTRTMDDLKDYHDSNIQELKVQLNAVLREKNQLLLKIEKPPAVKESEAAIESIGEVGEAAEKLDIEDEGWGWSPEEARLADEQHSLSALIPNAEIQLQARVAELEDRIKDLEAESAKLLEENKAAQIKSAKYVKKLKEYKVQYENLKLQLKSQQSTGFFDLDTAIQEELQAQIARLEKDLQEARSEYAKTVAEKEHLVKRIDVLSAANERFVEMKEKQDMEAEVYRIRNKELTNTVIFLEYQLGNIRRRIGERTKNEATSQPDEQSQNEQYQNQRQDGQDQNQRQDGQDRNQGQDGQDQNQRQDSQDQNQHRDDKYQKAQAELVKYEEEIEELKESLEALAAENEQLQQLLEEQRNERFAMEAKMSKDSEDCVAKVEKSEDANSELRSSYNKLVEEHDLLRKQYEQSLMDAHDQVQSMRQNSDLLRTELTEKSAEFQETLSRLNEQLQAALHRAEGSEEAANVAELLDSHVQKVKYLEEELEAQGKRRMESEARLEEDIRMLHNSVKEKEKQIAELMKDLEEKNEELVQQRAINNMSQELVQKHGIELQNKEQELQSIVQRCSEAEVTIENYLSELQAKNERIENWQKEIHHFQNLLKEKEIVLATMEQDNFEKQSALVQFENELEQSTMRVQTLSTELTEAAKQITSLKSALSDKESILHQYVEDMERLKVQIASKEVDIDRLINNLQYELERERHTKQQELANLEKTLEERNAIIEDLNKRIRENVEEPQLLEHTPTQTANIVHGLPLFTMGGVDEVDKLKGELEAKNTEIEHLQYALDKNTYPDIIQKLQDNLNAVYNEKDELEKSFMSSMEDLRVELKAREEEIGQLKQQLEVQKRDIMHKVEIAQLMAADKTSEQNELIKLQNELHTKEQEINELNYVIAEKESQLQQMTLESSDDFELRQSIAQFSKELTMKQEEIENLTSIVQKLQKEIAGLQDLERLAAEDRETIEKLTSEKERVRQDAEETIALKLREKEEEISNLKQQLSMENNQLFENLNLKERDVESLRMQLDQSIADRNEIVRRAENELEDRNRRLAEISITKDTEIYNLNVQIREKDARIDELLVLSQEEENQLMELKVQMQVHEQQMNGLKMQLDEKVQEYDLLQHALKRHVQRIDAGGDYSSSAVPQEGPEASPNELDLALYMLHQRDVRCEELTHELMQLLEERDTLQLRLSNAIRVNEDLHKYAIAGSNPNQAVDSGDVTVEHPSPSKSEGPVEIAKEALNSPIGEDKQALALKLSQLRTVDQGRDVRLRDDRELRHTQQMSLYAHKDVLSTLPPEAAAKIVNANYTLSRDVQSQSSVLLNWLWGKSTPKVVHM